VAVSAAARRTTVGRRSAAFLDKDGTVLRDVPYNVDPAHMELAPSAAVALRSLQRRGFALIVVSNQSGVARGYFSEQQVVAAAQHLAAMLCREGVALTGFYYCPHLEDGVIEQFARTCDCRKPRPGLLLRAARDHRIDLSLSWMIGDTLDDVEAGNRAGCRTILLNVGSETRWLQGEWRSPDYVASGMNEAASLILGDGASTPSVPLEESRP
jgi:D-glycero-D-manno-heptose 1,7-bisphosphate phosphatase